jgi:spore coat polysaccharide biosynthesis protein SpsF (cytidylyltransferase family)
MKNGIFITARLGSTRLEKKHLLPVRNQPVLTYLIRRIRREFQREMNAHEVRLVIVTSDEPENRQFEMFAAEGAAVFYGSKDNIPLRHLQAAQALSLDGIISVDGDDILCSVNGMRAIHDALSGNTPYARTSNLPFGMNSVGYSRAFLETSLRGHSEDILETGWGHIFDARQLLDISIPFPLQDNALRFTLDYPEDYEFFKAVIVSLGDSIVAAQDDLIVRTVIENKLFAINEPITKQYWDNFYKLQAKEKQRSTVTAEHSPGQRNAR